MKKPLLAAAGLLAILGTSYTVARHQIQGELQARQAKYEARIGDSSLKRTYPLSDWTDWDGLQYERTTVRKITQLEKAFPEKLVAFSKEIEQHTSQLEELTSSQSERHGVIEYDGSKFSIKTTDDWMIQNRSYTTEILQGDFTHKQQLLDVIKEYPQFLSAEETKVFPTLLEILQSKQELDRLSPEMRSAYGFSIKSKNGAQTPISQSEMQELATLGRQYLESLSRSWNFVSGQKLDDEFFNNSRIFARFHTHPKDDVNHSPSPPDEANTNMMGPGLLFSQYNGILHIYAVAEGKTKEILNSPISSK